MNQQESFEERYKNYDFEKDQHFQIGKHELLKQFSQQGTVDLSNEMDISILEEKVKRFYFERFVETKKNFNENQKDKKIDTIIDSTKNNNEKLNKNEVQENQNDNKINYQPKLSLAQIMKLIEEGKEIPGIRQIPNKLNELPPSKSKLTPRPKPWMK